MSSNTEGCQITIIISTKNRIDDLRKTLESIRTQSEPCEVLVLDDGSSDGTGEMVRDDFPDFRVVSNDQSTGYIVQRNRGARMATTPYLLSLDDDAVFSSPEVIGQTLEKFDYPGVGAVAIPLVDIREGPEVKQKAPHNDGVFVCERFKGTAYAVRRELFNSLGGFRECFHHQGEEGDFCIRLLQNKYVVRLGYGDPIHHFESARRDFSRVDHYGRRNDVLYAWFNVPLLFLLPHLGAIVFLGLRYGVRSRRLWAMAKGLGAGFLGIGKYFLDRKPVSVSTYLTSRRLKRSGSTRYEEVAKLFEGTN